MKIAHMIAFVLLVIGGLNWLLVGFSYNLVDSVLGVGSTGSKIVYILVGLSAIFILATHKSECKWCSAK